MRYLLILALFTVAVIMGACGGASANKSSGPGISFGAYDTSSSGASSAQVSPQGSGAGSGIGSGTGGGGGGGGGAKSVTDARVPLDQALNSQEQPTAGDRKIIRNGELAIECERPEDAQKRISSIATDNGGYVVDTEQKTSDPRSDIHDAVSMTIRVPSDKFDAALDQIKTASGKVLRESVKGQDVTEEFIDVEARLKAKQALEQQFMEIMKRANSVEDALSVQSQLADVRSDIEKIQGRKRFLESQSSLSTIKVQLQTPQVFAASSEGFGEKVVHAFSSGFDFALTFILGFVTFFVAALPFLVLVGLPGYLFVRYFIKRQKRSKTVIELAEEELEAS